MATPIRRPSRRLTTLKNSGGISAAQHKKIVEDNPRVFYGLNLREFIPSSSLRQANY
jgi:hypothetical protein